MRSLRSKLCGIAARSAMAIIISRQSAINVSGHLILWTKTDGIVRTMLSASNSAQGAGAVRRCDQSVTVVSPSQNGTGKKINKIKK